MVEFFPIHPPSKTLVAAAPTDPPPPVPMSVAPPVDSLHHLKIL
jgi:hypothetical protein